MVWSPALANVWRPRLRPTQDAQGAPIELRRWLVSDCTAFRDTQPCGQARRRYYFAFGSSRGTIIMIRSGAPRAVARSIRCELRRSRPFSLSFQPRPLTPRHRYPGLRQRVRSMALHTTRSGRVSFPIVRESGISERSEFDDGVASTTPRPDRGRRPRLQRPGLLQWR
jgi:hypothetical protein